MTATPNFAADAGAEAAGAAAPALSTGQFVLNLCSSTTPMALAQADLPELRRFTFFVSRRFEEGRERFRLHMGYFATLAEAEEWLGVVREIYPGAWAGETPGRKLRERAAAAAAAQAQHAAGPQTQVQATAARATVAPPPRPAARAVVTAPAPVRVPVVHAAPPVARAAAPLQSPPAVRPRQTAAPSRTPTAPAPAAAIGSPAPRAAAPAARVPARAGHPPAKTTPAANAIPVVPRTPPPAPPQRSLSEQRSVPAAARPAPATTPSASHAAVTSPAGAAARTVRPGAKPVFEDSNVREVLKALGDASATGETRLMRTPPAPREPAAANPALSDTQVLKMLETRRSEEGDPGSEQVDDSGIPMLKPDDTGTRVALKEAVFSNTAVAFAVQLQWSVQPVELDKVPPLAIFSAYTLYTVEGSRDGRRWYGLRLGFFSDAISAKQVAYYVRSEFTSVAVVPVSPQEKSRATEQDAAAALAAPVPTRADQMDEFKLLEDDTPSAPTPPAASTTPSRLAAAAAAQLPPKASPGGSAAKPGIPGRPRPRPTRAAPRESRGPQTLEETLEILGASQLTIDTGRGESINDSGVRHLRVEAQKNSPFSKLLERLSERLKKP
jgi:hypothetical protein